MTCTQFTQVAMLPQGRFQAFLRATSPERHAVLQRLFRTRRFEEVERWLVDRRVDLRRRSQTCHDRSAGVVSRIQEAAGVGLPAGWELNDLEPVVDDGRLSGWALGLSENATTEAVSLRDDLFTVTGQLELSRAACDRGKQLVDARSRGEKAQQSLAELDETVDVEAALIDSVDAHRRAASVLPAAMRAENAEAAAKEAESAASQHVSEVAQLLGLTAAEVRPAGLVEAATHANEARAVAESWLPRERELHDERARSTSLTAQVARLELQIADADKQRARTTADRDRLLPLLNETGEIAAHLEARQVSVETAAQGLAAAEQVIVLGARLEEARVLLEQTTRHALDLREHHLDLRERRISGMAAELALGLAAGCSCPVCGSAEHPSPAIASGRVSRADEDAARERHESADFERQAVQESVTALETQLEAARERAQDRDVTAWQRTHRDASSALEQSRAALQRQEALEAEVTALTQTENRLVTALATSRAGLEIRTQQHEDSEARCSVLAAELRELLVDHPGTTSVAALVELHSATLRVLEAAREALTAREHADRELSQATTAAEAAATTAGFASLTAALQAVLAGGEAATRSTELERRRAARAAAATVLAETDVAEALAQAVPDLAALTARVSEVESARDRAHAEHQQATVRAARLGELVRELAKELTAWEPVRREHLLVTDLAALVEGKSVDNQLKMRLSAYVLSERLRQVVAAANERLGEMTDERYTLEQADEKGAGEQRGGLSLRVRDEWSGKQRDPATLSGGETFLVSLALALGLADTVSHEAGGIQLETLFIDEGFGALDATTLDAVMDTLDSLRDGGRVVGLVSHVLELRNRVPAQLEVRKARRGSTVCASLATG